MVTKAVAPTKGSKKTKSGESMIPELIEMLEAGVHFGHDRSKRNPRMEPYIFMQRNRIAIFDLSKTQAALQKAVDFLHQLSSRSESEVLFVGTKRQVRDIVRRRAEEAGMPYVTQRWLGGTLTNFSTIQKSIEKLEQLKSEQANSKLQAKLTKKEKAVRQKEIERLEEILEGIKNMRRLPAAVIVAGSYDEKLAVKEARRVKVPVIGITDTNADPSQIDYPIPANDDAVRALDLIIGTLTKAILSSRKSPLKTPAAAQAKKASA